MAERALARIDLAAVERNCAELKRRLTSFQQELLALCDADEEPEVVYQVGMQLFPLSRPKASEETAAVAEE